MKKIPDFKFYTPQKWEKERLAKWIKVWKFDQELKKTFDSCEESEISSELSEFEKAQLSRKFKENINKFNANIKAGDIRLLSPDLTEEDSIPRYVAVIRKWDENDFLVAPFSIYSIPAVQGEMQTDHDHFSLANLELWNAIIVPHITLQKSWLADKMSEKELEDAFAVFKFISSGEELPEHLAEKIGSPIFKDNDPRIEYQDSEQKIFVPLRLKIDKDIEIMDKIKSFIVYMNLSKIKLMLAADDGEKTSNIFMFSNSADIEKAMKEDDFNKYTSKTISAKNIIFDIDSEKADLRWTFETDENLNCSEIVLAIDRITGKIIEKPIIIKDDDEPYLIIIEEEIKLRQDIMPEEIILIIIKE